MLSLAPQKALQKSSITSTLLKKISLLGLVKIFLFQRKAVACDRRQGSSAPHGGYGLWNILMTTVVTDLNLIWPNFEKVNFFISILANTVEPPYRVQPTKSTPPYKVPVFFK